MSDVAVITHRIGQFISLNSNGCAAQPLIIDIGSGNIYLGGPPLVKAATGEVVTGEELGGAVVLSHGPGGNGDFTS